MERILAAQSSGLLEIYVSALVQEEMEDIPAEYRAPHLAQFARLEVLAVLPVIQATPPFRPTDFPHGTRTHPLLERLLNVLDRVDAEHVFQVAQRGLCYFITLDFRSILRRAVAVESVSGVKALKPVDFEMLLASRGIDPSPLE